MGSGHRPEDADVAVTQATFDLDATLSALADPYRRRTVDLLSEGPLRAGELAQAIGLPPPAMSRHLRVLRNSGLVEESHPHSDARVRIYTLRPAPMLELKHWLDEMETHWNAQLAAFKAHVEVS
jgi:DNA-binding transcriptional ArsR family regulator